MNENGYDIVVIFDHEITIDDGPIKEGGNGFCKIYGLLYKREEKHRNENWSKDLQIHLAYLMGCERLQKNGGDMSKTEWFLPNGRVVPLTQSVIFFIYKILLPEIMGYRIVEFDKPFELGFRQNDEIFLLSREPLESLGLVEKEIQNNNSGYDEEDK